MQQHIYNDQREQPPRQHMQDSDYPYLASTPNSLEEPIASIPFEQPRVSEPYPYQDGYRGPHEPLTSSGHVPPLGQQVYYVPIFRVQEPGIDGKILAAISYIGFWLTGLLLLLFVRENRFIRFHALQSFLFFGGTMMLYIIAPFAFVGFWRVSPFVPIIAAMGFFVVTIVAAVAWFVGFIGALSGKCYKLPLAGDLAELLVKPNQTGTVK